MANLGSLAALISAIDAAITTNGGNDITGAILNGILQDVADTLTGVGVQPKVYIAYLTQTGTAAPTAAVVVNTLGATPVFARSNPGEYSITTSGLFVVGKTVATPIGPLSVDSGGLTGITLAPADVNTVNIIAQDEGVAADDFLTGNRGIHITVYP